MLTVIKRLVFLLSRFLSQPSTCLRMIVLSHGLRCVIGDHLFTVVFLVSTTTLLWMKLDHLLLLLHECCGAL